MESRRSCLVPAIYAAFGLCIASCLFPHSVSASVLFHPSLTWLRSTESEGAVRHETLHHGSIYSSAASLPLDTTQTVFDNGEYAPEEVRSSVSEGVKWISWPAYPQESEQCGYRHSLRRLQAQFEVPESVDLTRLANVYVRSPYYSWMVPHAYTGAQVNTLIPRRGFITHFWINPIESAWMNGNPLQLAGTAPAFLAAETNGEVVASRVLAPPQNIIQHGSNALTFILASSCTWGAMGEVEIVLELSGDEPVVLDTPTSDTGFTKPFLRLPWDYAAHGKSFADAALAINSFFDHTYPFLSVGLGEGTLSNQVTNYRDDHNQVFYSSHDGYDYGRYASAFYSGPQLAAAQGSATYNNACRACGNAIYIDHKNGYQTRYYHLAAEGLITNIPGEVVPVVQGQPIGRIGFTGNVSPRGESGAHIHFMVVQDKNKDGNFEDNVPDGLVDPFGWQAEGEDPWVQHAFSYGGVERTGNISTYLWQERIPNLVQALPLDGGELAADGRYTLGIPPLLVEHPARLQTTRTALPSPLPDGRMFLTPPLSVRVLTAAGDAVEHLSNALTIRISLADLPLPDVDLSSLSIVSRSEGTEQWVDEVSSVDDGLATIEASVTHLSEFGVVALPKDVLPPITELLVEGTTPVETYSAPFTVTLAAHDADSPVLYTAVHVDDGEWEAYLGPKEITGDGEHTLRYYSEDTAGNIETIQSRTITISSVPPQLTVAYDATNHIFHLDAFPTGASVHRTQDTVVVTNGSAHVVLTIKEVHTGVRHDVVVLPEWSRAPIEVRVIDTRRGNAGSVLQTIEGLERKPLHTLYSARENRTRRIYAHQEAAGLTLGSLRITAEGASLIP